MQAFKEISTDQVDQKCLQMMAVDAGLHSSFKKVCYQDKQLSSFWQQ